ncbi:MAG: oligosaccharide flippase family protein [Candidatus Altiarchaeota archaeon]|nr:oligosaccharide flippase family protein [Candidatus Altiarchaeota archaeon]
MASRWYSVLVKENAYGVLSQAIMILAGIIFAIVFPRILGPERFGDFSLVFALANLFLFFCEFGLGSALMKLLPSSVVRKDTASYYRFFSTLKYVLVVASSAALFIFSDLLASSLFRRPDLGLGVRVSALFLFSYSLYGFYDTVLASVKKNKLVFYLNAVFQSCRIALPLVSYYLYRSYVSVLLGLGLAALMGFIAGFLLKRSVRVLEEGRGVLDYRTMKKYFFYGSLGYLGVLFIQWMDSLVIGVFINSTELAFYRVGVMWMGVVWLFIPFSGRVLLALYSEKTESLEHDKISTVYSYSLRYSLIIAFLLITGVWLTSDYFITMLYGMAYEKAVPVVLIMSFLAIESSLNAINSPLLQGVGRIGAYTKYSLLSGLASIMAAIYASSYGILGVAAAITAVRTLFSLLITIYVFEKLKIHPHTAVAAKPVAASFATVIILWPFKDLVVSPLLWIGFVAVVVAVYSLCALVLRALSPSEVRRILSAVRDR